MKRLLPLWIIIFIFLFYVDFSLFATDNLRISDIRSAGMGANGVTQSSLFNPSLLSLYNNKQVCLGYFNRYNIKEMGSLTASLVYPLSYLSTAVNISTFGFDDYRESIFRVSVAKKLGYHWHLGVSFHYSLFQSVLHEDNMQRVGTDLGMVYTPVENLLIAISMLNMPSIGISKNNSDNKMFTPYIVQAGFEWKFINNLLIASSMGYGEDTKFKYSIGLEYEPFDRFAIRAGIETNPFIPSMGVGYKIAKFSFNVAALYHRILGMSSGIGMNYHF